MLDYSSILSNQVSELKPSGIRKFFDLLSDLNDPDMIALTVGQPDFVTPWSIREAGIESLEKGKTYYTANAGDLALRREISNYLSRRFSISYDPVSEIVVTVGGSEAIDMAIRACINPGDEIIIPEPCFVCYEPMVHLMGGKAVIVTTEEKDKFKLTPEKLRGAKPELRILHPLPRVNEIDTAIDADPRAAYFRQALNGKFVRMALIMTLLDLAKEGNA